MATPDGSGGEQRIFLRKASGLIRTAGTMDRSSTTWAW